jgi:hypothetical protein
LSRDERVDIIDFIINVLKEHEKNLDTQINKLEEIVAISGTARPSQGEAMGRVSRVKVAVNDWSEFREKGKEPQMLAFNISDEKLEVSALKDGTLFVYCEEIPELSMTVEREEGKLVTRGGNFIDLFDSLSLIAGSLQCGMPVKHSRVDFKLPEGNVVQKIIFKVDSEAAKSWLSKQLGVEKTSIIIGSIEF